jgi:hypothetical protein
VVGTGFGYDRVIREGLEPFLAELLDLGLVIRRTAGGLDLPDCVLEEPDDERSGRTDSAVKIELCDKGFETVGEERVLVPSAGLLFASSQQQVFAEADLPSHGCKGRLAYHGGTETGKISLGGCGKGAHQTLAYHEVQDGVPQELHPLIVFGQAVFVRVGPVGERALQQIGLTERVADMLLELRGGPHVTTGIF